MNRFKPSWMIWSCFLIFLAAGNIIIQSPGWAASLPATEQEKIERLIAAVQKLESAAFIRNGSSYSADTAVRFLRGKWQTRRGEVLSAEDFIAKVASGSSTTGRPYYIRFQDGRQLPSAQFFRSQLAAIEKGKK